MDPLAAALAAFLEALTDRWGVALEDVESVRLEGDYAPHAAPQVLVRSRLFVQGPVTRDLFVTLPTDGAR